MKKLFGTRKFREGYSINVSTLKWIAAIMVIMAHAFPLSTGSADNEWFTKLTNHQITMGSFAVLVFFFYSGFFIYQSAKKTPQWIPFFWKRIIRIFPPLLLVVIFTVFILGPCVTTLSLKEYFCSPLTYSYLLNSFFVLVHNLPGVFNYNIYLPTVNGALWTLPVEFMCYLGCFMLVQLKWNKKPWFQLILGAVFAIMFLLHIASSYGILSFVQTVLLPCALFFLGMFLREYYSKIPASWCLFIISITIIMLSNFAGILSIGLLLGLPYVLLFLGYGIHSLPGSFGNLGKISYGIYLCGFPIQQTIVFLFGGQMNPLVNMSISIVLANILGIVVYFLGENNLIIKKLSKVELLHNHS